MDNILTKKDLNITFNNEELNQMLNLVKNPETMDSVSDMKKNIISYSLLEKLEIYVAINFGKEIIDELDGFVEGAFNSDIDNFINQLLKSEDFTDKSENQLAAVMIYIYCVHKINKRENSYKLK